LLNVGIYTNMRIAVILSVQTNLLMVMTGIMNVHVITDNVIQMIISNKQSITYIFLFIYRHITSHRGVLINNRIHVRCEVR